MCIPRRVDERHASLKLPSNFMRFADIFRKNCRCEAVAAIVRLCHDLVKGAELGDDDWAENLFLLISSAALRKNISSCVRYPIPAALTDRSIFKTGPGVGEQALLKEALTMPAREGQASPLLLHAIFLVALTSSNEKLVQQGILIALLRGRLIIFVQKRCTTSITSLSSPPLRPPFIFSASGGLDLTTKRTRGIGKDARWPWHNLWDCIDRMWNRYSLVLGYPTNQPNCSTTQCEIRDRVAAAALGRPCRIRDEDCDIERPSKEDLDGDEEHDHILIPSQEDYHVLYFLEMSKLATIGKPPRPFFFSVDYYHIGSWLTSYWFSWRHHHAEFSPHRPALEKYDANALGNRLSEWETQLPDILRPQPPTSTLDPPFWAGMLNAFHQYALILLFRPKSIGNLPIMEVERDMRARTATDFITRAAEDLLAASTIKHAQIHLTVRNTFDSPSHATSAFRVPALFGALSIHTLVICRKDPIHRQLAENKSRQCMLALSELAKSWPVGMWVVKSFLNLMKRLTSQGSTSGGSTLSVTSCITTGDGATASLLNHGSLARGQPAIESAGNIIYSNQISPNGLEAPMPSSRVGNVLGAQHREQQPSEYYLQTSYQLVYDSFWLGCLDYTFDFDSFQASLGPVAPLSFENTDP
ncbi:hypothetical protein ACJZ2D_000375 [Fusarium nematophilum]